MLTSKFLKGIMTEAYPVIKRQVEDAQTIAAFRDVVAANGGDWAALKALIKAHVEDTLDETSEGKRVRKILEKADSSNAYADMLGLNMNEQNFSADDDFDPFTGVIIEPNPAPADFSSPATAEAGEAAYTLKAEASPADIQADVDADVEEQELIEIAEGAPVPSGEAADAAGGSNAPAVLPKLKMNPEFFNDPHPGCRRPDFCGGNSNLGLCEVCAAAFAPDRQHAEATN